MQKMRLTTEAVLLLSVIGTASGQAAPNVNQAATRSSCSNIVALSGAKVDCFHLTQEQSRTLAEIPGILKLALENRGYYEEIMAKLREFSPSTTTIAPNTNGPDSVAVGVNNGNITVHPVDPPPPPPIQDVRIVSMGWVSSATPGYPYDLRLVLQTNVVISPPSFKFACDAPIAEGHWGCADGGPPKVLDDWSQVLPDSKSYLLAVGSPAFTPVHNIVLDLFSKTPFKLVSF